MSTPDAVTRVIAAVRANAPLVHCLTAAVSMNYVANALLAAGARAMMTETAEEAPHLVAAASALLINLGTLSTDGAAGIPATVSAARRAGVPWVLDPAAIGRPPVRTRLAAELVAHGPAAIRCNASEALVLAGVSHGGQGADATDPVAAAEPAASELARRHGTVVAVSGPVDALTDGDRVLHVASGSPLLPRVTGTGCALGALTAACVAVVPAVSVATLDAVAAAHAWLGLAAERAAERAEGPGSFAWLLLDALDAVPPDAVSAVLTRELPGRHRAPRILDRPGPDTHPDHPGTRTHPDQPHAESHPDRPRTEAQPDRGTEPEQPTPWEPTLSKPLPSHQHPAEEAPHAR